MVSIHPICGAATKTQEKNRFTKIRNLQRNFWIMQHMLSSLLWLLHRWGETESPAGQIKNEQIQTQQGLNCFTNVNRKRVKQADEEDFCFCFFCSFVLFFF